jgi:two-component sensor histidine kinase
LSSRQQQLGARARGWSALGSRLRFHSWPMTAKILLALAACMLPLGVLALFSSYRNYEAYRQGQRELAQVRFVALEQTVDARLEEIFSTLQSALLNTSSDPTIPRECRESLPALDDFVTPVARIARIPGGDQPTCSLGDASLPLPPSLAFPREQRPGTRRFARQVLPSPDERASLILATQREQGASTGDMVLGWLAPSGSRRLLRPEDYRAEREQVALIYDGPLASQRLIARWGPDVLSASEILKRAVEGQSIEVLDGRWQLSFKRLDRYDLSLAMLTPNRAVSASQVLTIGLPAVMWITALGIGWLAINRIVAAPLARMRRLVERYGAGERSIRLSKLDFGSQEMSGLASTFDGMAAEIDSHEEEMLTALATQKRLTREVHHRVKNNLQIVSSLLSIQSREASTPENVRVYSGIQQRVNALALVHRWLYDDESMRGVDLKSLFHDLSASLEQSLESAEHIQLTIRSDVDRLLVSQDLAVPLAFLVTELVVCAARQADDGSLILGLSAQLVEGRGCLAVEAPSLGGEDPFARSAASSSARIVQGLARQMRSNLRFDVERSRYEIAFPVVGPAQARARSPGGAGGNGGGPSPVGSRPASGWAGSQADSGLSVAN